MVFLYIGSIIASPHVNYNLKSKGLPLLNSKITHTDAVRVVKICLEILSKDSDASIETVVNTGFVSNIDDFILTVISLVLISKRYLSEDDLLYLAQHLTNKGMMDSLRLFGDSKYYLAKGYDKDSISGFMESNTMYRSLLSSDKFPIGRIDLALVAGLKSYLSGHSFESSLRLCMNYCLQMDISMMAVCVLSSVRREYLDSSVHFYCKKYLNDVINIRIQD